MRDIKTREGFEFWDKLNALPRYAFLLSPSGNSVQKFEDQAMGNWIDVHEAQKIVDQAQEQISELQDELKRQKGYVEINANSAQGKHAEGQRYRDERDALQQRLNAADQRIDELTTQQTESRVITLSGCEFSEHELLRTAVRMVTGTSRRGTQRWVAMKDAFCCGSGVAHALCRRFGFDPDETVKP
ncbi:hypothetical protein [Pseudomonas serboccidentalis]|uniref:hypothetical protein n=1 Tax=Pseudomonas serboccidentalis TaxID=2964670 RepID=UPI0039DFBBEB